MMMMMMTPGWQHTLHTATNVHKLNRTESSSSTEETEKGLDINVYHRVAYLTVQLIGAMQTLLSLLDGGAGQWVA